MPDTTNIYAMIIHSLPPKVREYIRGIDKAGQIDHDSNNMPIITGVQNNGSNVTVYIMRNGRLEHAIVNTRKRSGSNVIASWDETDGFVRSDDESHTEIGDERPSMDGGETERTRRSFEYLYR